MPTPDETRTSCSRHVTYWPGALDRTAGGPSGYLWHLNQGVSRLTGRGLEIVGGSQSPPAAPFRPLRPAFADAPSVRRLATRLGITSYAREAARLSRSPASAVTMPAERGRFLAGRLPASVHCHSTTDLLAVHNALEMSGRRREVALILTSHSPEMPGREAAAALRAAGASRLRSLSVEKGLVRLDEAAFIASDAIVFPCPESMEPYESAWAGFRDAVQSRAVAYVPTGIDHGSIASSRQGTGTTRIGFVGRHNSIKGYDLLRSAFGDTLETDGIEVLCAGTAGPIEAPRRTGWTELGRIQGPDALFELVDAVILPNRQTYFDILALECMAAGLPLLASATGGNRYLGRMSPGVILFEPTASSLRAAVLSFSALPSTERNAMGAANREAYLAEFTADRFASRYIDAIHGLVNHAIPAD